MGLLDSVVGALAGGQQGGGSPLLNLVLQFINNQPGGLAGLLQAFQRGGLGDVAQSWVSTGQNLPISGEQLQGVLGSDLIQNLAAQMGMSTGQASGSLAELLPRVIDQLTPDGQLPQGGDLLSQGLSLLTKGGFFK